MSSPLFSTLPDEARLWVYAADRPLTAAEQTTLTRRLMPFLASWTSHGRPVQGAMHLLHDRFLLVAAVLAGGADISGCGIDASVHAVEEAAEAVGVRWLSPLEVLYRDDEGQIRHVPRSGFRQLVRAGTVTGATPVFDLSLTTVGALRAQGLERPASAGWHARVFRIPQPA
ncbi:MAG: hypothetical protein D6685_04065 [Bacteroidetes bacterium]|nr:hypothetical protein AWN76_000015 [Rhodothermaceae bacterium RA]RMH67167.1 MAG: hypothetical protein D6685_04065 [Bacteroidota bacterium]